MFSLSAPFDDTADERILAHGELRPGGYDLLSDSLEVVHAHRPSTATEYRPDAKASAITRSGRAFDFPQ